MKKLIVCFMAIGLLGAGCAHQQTAANNQTLDQNSSATAQAGGAKSGHYGTNGSISDKDLALLQSRVKDINFDFDRYDIKKADKHKVKDIANILKQYTALGVMIEGNCDNRGTVEYNMALGEKRANAAKQYLNSLGIQKARINTVSYGKEKPICTESTEACWAKNRRDHFILK